MFKRITIFLAVALLLFSGMALAQEPEPTKEELLMLRILEFSKELQNAKENNAPLEEIIMLNDQLEKAKEERNNYLEEQEAIDDFDGFGMSVGPSITFVRSDEELIEEAEVVNGIVRVSREGNAITRLTSETHYFFKISNTVGIGPFVGILSSKNDILDAFGLGFMVGLRRLGKDSSRSFNLGVGWVWDRNVKVLGDGVIANMPLPEGEIEIRYKYKTLGGVMLLASFSF